MILFLRKYCSNFFIPLVWSLIIATLCCLPGSMLPHEAGFAIPQFDKFVHISMFGGFVFLWNLYLVNRISGLTRLLGLFFVFYVLGNAFGIGMEYVQKYWIPGRDYDLADIVADMMGAGLGYGLSNLLFIPARNSAQPS